MDSYASTYGRASTNCLVDNFPGMPKKQIHALTDFPNLPPITPLPHTLAVPERGNSRGYDESIERDRGKRLTLKGSMLAINVNVVLKNPLLLSSLGIGRYLEGYTPKRLSPGIFCPAEG